MIAIVAKVTEDKKCDWCETAQAQVKVLSYGDLGSLDSPIIHEKICLACLELELDDMYEEFQDFLQEQCSKFANLRLRKRI